MYIKIVKFCAVVLLMFWISVGMVSAGNIGTGTTSSSTLAYGHNNTIGYINFGLSGTSSVTVSDTELTGYAWGQNVGWINLHSTSSTWGVVNDGAGNLSGYAWGENLGWINFNAATSGQRVTIDSSGDFHGFAWSQARGWISFNCLDSGSCGTNFYKVNTTWTPGVAILATCSPSVSSIPMGNSVTWTVNASGGNGTFTYAWTGTDSLSGSTATVGKIYSSIGSKTATVTVSSGATSTIQSCGSMNVTGSSGGTGGTTPPPPATSCNNGAINYSTCTICATGQGMYNGSCTTCPTGTTLSAGMCVVSACENNATNYPTCTTCAAGKGLFSGSCVSCPTDTVLLDGICVANSTCVNDATNFPTCTTCATGKGIFNGTCSTCPSNTTLKNNVCVVTGCLNQATNPPTCDNNVCTNGATNFPTCDNVCLNKATNYPDCNNICLNSATNFPTCDNEETVCKNSATNPPACDNDVCTNGATNFPTCNNICLNGATNFPTCNNICLNGATNYPTCSNDVCSNGATNYPACDNNTTPPPPNNPPTTPPNTSISDTSSGNNVISTNDNGTVEVKIGSISIPIVPAFIAKTASESYQAIKNVTQETAVATKKVINTTSGSVTTKAITTTGVVAAGATATLSLVFNPMSLPEIFLLPLRLWGLLMSALGLRKRNRPWGTVYDSITKQPLDPAYVVLQDESGKEVVTSITDLDGRYGFFANKGNYKIVANKTNYTFPSKRLQGKLFDELYKDLYFGEALTVAEDGGIIAKNIPLDPEKFDWNEVAKKNMGVMRFYSKYDLIIKKLTNWLFGIGVVISVLAFWSAPFLYNSIILGLYLVMLLLRVFGVRPKYFGWILDKNTGFPMAFAIVRIYSLDMEREMAQKACDSSGRYYALVPPGQYTVTIDRKNQDETYTTIYTSPVLMAKKGVINQVFKV